MIAGRRMALCHPTRHAWRGDECRACVQLAAMRLGEDGLPPQIRGVQRFAGPEIPVSCPRCHATPPGWHIEWTHGRCMSCGQRWYRTSNVVLDLPKIMLTTYRARHDRRVFAEVPTQGDEE